MDEHRFIDVFFKARNQRVDLAVIEHGQRIFGYRQSRRVARVIQVILTTFRTRPQFCDTEAGRILLEDERRFIDLPNSPIFFAEDHVVIEG